MSCIGWLAWLYGLLAESDTGYPDGLGCSANPLGSDSYVSCMEYAERGGAVVWAVTLLLAVAALTLLARARLGVGRGAGQIVVGVLAMLTAGSLALAGVSVWIEGARGSMYEGRIGALSWHAFNVLAVLAGAGGVGLSVRRRHRRASSSGRPRDQEPTSSP